MTISIHPLHGIPIVVPGDDVSKAIVDACRDSGFVPERGDVFVVCQKIVSKAEGRIVALADVKPGERAAEFAAEFGKDPAVVELALREAVEILRMQDGHLITSTGPGWICANSGLDRSNQNADGQATLLPIDSDASAQRILAGLKDVFDRPIGVIVSDTFGRPWRMGQLDVAIGSAGIAVLDDHEGRGDWTGRTLEHTLIAVADQLAAAAGLLMGKADGVPVVVVRGAPVRMTDARAAELVRQRELDMFR